MQEWTHKAPPSPPCKYFNPNLERQKKNPASLAFIGANRHSGIPEQEFRAGHSGVVDHGPADVGIHHTTLVTVVYELQRQLKVVAYSNFHGWEDKVHISWRKVRRLSLTAVLLGFLQNGPLLHAAYRRWAKHSYSVC